MMAAQQRRCWLLPAAVWEVLAAAAPTHKQRLWLVYYLKAIGYAVEEVVDLIDETCDWSNYKRSLTEYHVRWIFNDRKGKKGTTQRRSPYDYQPPNLREHPRPPSLDRLNDAFLAKGMQFAMEYAPDQWSWNPREIRWHPHEVALFRTTESYDGSKLLVIDIDGPLLPSAFTGFQAMASVQDWDHAKFSSSKGFHLVKEVPGPVSYGRLQALAFDAIKEAGGRFVRGFRSDKGDKAQVRFGRTLVHIDGAMFTPRRLIRCYSFNWKSNMVSCAVYEDDKLSDILRRASSGSIE